MARPRATGVQQNTDGRKFVKVPAGSGKKVYLAKTMAQSNRWLVVLDGLDDVVEARRRIALLKAAKNRADEDERIASILTTPKQVWLFDRKDVQALLTELLEPFAVVVSLPMAEHWIRIHRGNLATAPPEVKREIVRKDFEMIQAWGLPFKSSDEWSKWAWGDSLNWEKMKNPSLRSKEELERNRLSKALSYGLDKTKLNPEWMEEQKRFGMEELAQEYQIPADTMATLRTIVETRELQAGIKASKQKLSDCFDEWARIKSLQPSPPDETYQRDKENFRGIRQAHSRQACQPLDERRFSRVERACPERAKEGQA